MDLGHRFWADLETTPGGKATEDAQKGVLKHTGYGSTMAIWLGFLGTFPPKGAVCFGNAANFRRWLKPSFACFWTPGVEKRFRHVMTSVHAPQNPQKSKENTTVWNIMEHSKHLENYK